MIFAKELDKYLENNFDKELSYEFNDEFHIVSAEVLMGQ